MMIRRETFDSIGIFDEKLQAAQEAELVIRIAQISPICRINEPTFIYRAFISDKKEFQTGCIDGRIPGRIFTRNTKTFTRD